MSLMQVVGASFAHVPVSHANSLLSHLNVPAAQPSQLAQPLHNHTTLSQPTVAQCPDPPFHDTQNTRLENKPDTVSELQCREQRAADQQCVEAEPGLNTHEESRLSLQVISLNSVLCPRCGMFSDCLLVLLLAWPQDLQQLTIHPDLSQNSHEERSHFIPSSKGLLTTVDNQAPLQAPQQNRPFEKTVPLIQGLKLLHLPSAQSPPAPVKEAWGPNQHKPSMYRKSEDYKRYAEPTAQPPQWRPNQNGTQTRAYTSSDRGREREVVRLPPAPNMAVGDMGFPLLRLPPDTQMRPIQLPQIPLSATTRFHTTGSAAEKSFPKPQLLRVEPVPSRTVSTIHLHTVTSSSIELGI